MTEPAQSAVRIDAIDDVLHVVLDRPDAKNSLTPDAVRDMIAALESAAADDSVRVVASELHRP